MFRGKTAWNDRIVVAVQDVGLVETSSVGRGVVVAPRSDQPRGEPGNRHSRVRLHFARLDAGYCGMCGQVRVIGEFKTCPACRAIRRRYKAARCAKGAGA